MTILTNASLTPAQSNSGLFTYFTLFKVTDPIFNPSANNLVSLTEFGYQTVTNSFGTFEAYNSLWASGDVVNGYDVTAIVAGPAFPLVNVGGVDVAPFDISAWGINQVYPAISLTAKNCLIDLQGWNLILVAINLSTPDRWLGMVNPNTASVTQGSLFSISVNQNTYFATQGGLGGTFVPTQVGGFGVGVYSTFRSNVDAINHANSINAAIQVQASGLEYSEPVTLAHADLSFQQARSCTQAWLNQYVAPTAPNFDKFYYISNDKIYPRGGKVAADAFGDPDVWLERDSVSGVLFQQNNGTAGDFTVVGTDPEDFTPGPEEGIEIIE